MRTKMKYCVVNLLICYRFLYKASQLTIDIASSKSRKAFLTNFDANARKVVRYVDAQQKKQGERTASWLKPVKTLQEDNTTK